ncbi:hypothetical protein DMH26_41880 [Streptomyces sp. WAC 05379]|nr:hypothetical protein DMH26_41880 [Streptomyces sp. WAC 05379]
MLGAGCWVLGAGCWSVFVGCIVGHCLPRVKMAVGPMCADNTVVREGMGMGMCDSVVRQVMEPAGRHACVRRPRAASTRRRSGVL